MEMIRAGFNVAVGAITGVVAAGVIIFLLYILAAAFAEWLRGRLGE